MMPPMRRVCRAFAPDLRRLGALLAIATVLGCGSSTSSDTGAAAPQPPAPTPAPEPTGETLGFVISSFGYLYPEHEGDVCPGGFNLGPVDFRAAGNPIEDDCLDPEGTHDPTFKTLDAAGRVDGFDLDGLVSRKSSPAENECAHDDFSGLSGGDGYDFQLWRALGCIRGNQPGEIQDTIIGNSVRDGSSTLLIEVQGVDDENEDESVQVRVFASTQAPAASADGELLPFGTLSVHADERYHGTRAPGSIVERVVIAGPADFRWRFNIQIVEADLSLHDAYVRLEILEDGTARGQFFGYTSVEEMYEIFGVQAGRSGADALGYTCSGLYSALNRQADGDFDPETGTCSSLSVAYRFEAVPAFIAR